MWTKIILCASIYIAYKIYRASRKTFQKKAVPTTEHFNHDGKTLSEIFGWGKSISKNAAHQILIDKASAIVTKVIDPWELEKSGEKTFDDGSVLIRYRWGTFLLKADVDKKMVLSVTIFDQSENLINILAQGPLKAHYRLRAMMKIRMKSTPELRARIAA